MTSPLDGNGVAWACVKCNSTRSVDPCPKCGTALTKPADGWDWPTLPDIDRIRALAREVGYAIGVHGSLERDLDLIAVPWVADAVEPLALAQHIAAGLGGEVIDYQRQDKPCGRWACNIHTPDWTKMIDLSVMPPLAPSHTAVEPVAWLTEWKRDGEEWVNAHANEVTALDEARAYGAAITPLVPLSALTAQAAALVAAESNAERMERNWRTAAALVERHEATIEVQSNKLIAAESEVAPLKARVADLEADRDQAQRNRDMWKAQCERQAAQATTNTDFLDFVVRRTWDNPLSAEEALSAIQWHPTLKAFYERSRIDPRRLTHQEKNNG